MCRGATTKRALDDLFLFIEKGTPDGHEEKFRDAGDELVDVRAGEVIFKILETPHAKFTRDGDNLKLEQEISLRQALLGFKIEVPHLDHHKVTLEKRPGQTTQHGEANIVKGEGMPKYGSPSDFGDLIVTFKVKSPESLDFGQKAAIKQIFEKK